MIFSNIVWLIVDTFEFWSESNGITLLITKCINQTQTKTIVQFLDFCFDPQYISNTTRSTTGFDFFFFFFLNLGNLRMELIRMHSFFFFFGGLKEFLFVSRTVAFEIL